MRKTEEVARLQDLLIYTLKGISEIVIKGKLDVKDLGNTNYEMLNSLFMTITNANFDDESIEKQILKMLAVRDSLKKLLSLKTCTMLQHLQWTQERQCWKRPLL